ncbi:MAG: sigma-70 family RNA polymerase sigma factor [Burkholderiales bacterium]|nr:sigma-70 family RNA polymerase sigma factor [Phycisphaerae bacterium]
MVIRDNGELLVAWSDDRSSDAFEELVRRHVDLVYATAVRSLGGDRQLADDVTQAVFLILSKKARTIRSGAALPAWLHQTTRYAATNARKMQSRRRRHEQIAAAQRTEVAMHASPDLSLLPDLDAAIASLNATDRAAIIARYLKGQDLITVAGELGTTVDAAQKRIERSIQKLRDFFIRKQVKATTGGVAGTLASVKIFVAPPHVTSTTLGVIVHGHQASAAAVAIEKGTSTTMMWIKIKTAGLMTGAAAILVCTGIGLAQLIDTKTAIATEPQTLNAPTTVAADDLQHAIQGQWRIAKAWDNGTEVPADHPAIRTTRFTFDGQQLTMSRDGRGKAGPYSLDTSHTPAWIDLGDQKVPAQLTKGLIKIVDGKLHFITGRTGVDRSTAFESVKGNVSNNNYYVLERDTPTAGDLRLIQGEWEFVRAVSDGREAPADQLGQAKVVITDRGISITNGTRTREEMSFKLNPDNNPKQIDQFDTANPTRLIPGIYVLEGDTLRICFNDKNPIRPTEFVSGRNTGKLWVLRRAAVAVPAAQ